MDGWMCACVCNGIGSEGEEMGERRRIGGGDGGKVMG